MDINNSVFCLLPQNLQSLQIKDVLGGNFGIIVLYLRGSLLLFGNCNKLPTDTIGLLNDTFTSVARTGFTEYIKAVYFIHKRGSMLIEQMEFLTLPESKYRTLYCNLKWDAARDDPGSVFFSEIDAEEEEDKDEVPRRRHRIQRKVGRGGWYGRGGEGDWLDVNCHNCGKYENFQRDYWLPGGRVFAKNTEGDNPNGRGDDFPGVDNR